MWVRFIMSFVVLAVSLQVVLAQKTERIPFQKKPTQLKSPTEYARRVLRIDSKTGTPVYYDPKPRVTAVDLHSGKYALNWVGYDGKEKTILFQRANAIDAVISAMASKNASGKYRYTYTVKNLASSPNQLSWFAIQTFTSDAQPLPLVSGGFVGQMSNNKTMKEGNWFGFGSTNFEKRVGPGQSVELTLLSSSPPGLVECRITGGDRGMKGVGEHMPQELENVLPGYEDWPYSYTIGPVDELRNFSQQEKVAYLLKALPPFKQLGWITPSTSLVYEQLLKRNDWQGLLKRIAGDLKTGSITTEVFAIVEGMRS